MDWVQCPTCLLKHRPREDATCPRCRSPLAVAMAAVDLRASPEGADPASPPHDAPFIDESQFNADATAMRVAGLILLANAAIGILLLVLIPRPAFEWPDVARGDWQTLRDLLSDRGLLLSGIIWDVLVGGALLAVRRRVLPLAIFRAVAGGLVFTAASVADDDLRGAILQVSFSGAQLLLLWGRAETGRIIAGGVCGAATFGLFLLYVGLAAMEDPPHKPVDRSQHGLQGRPITPGPPPRDPARPPPERLLDVGGDVTGYTYPIEMERPARSWQLRPASYALESDDDAQFWWVEPRSFAELRVLRHVPSMGVTLSIEAERFTRRLRNHWESWEGVRSGPAFHARVEGEIPPEVDEARITVSGAPHRIHVEVHAMGSAAWAIIYSAPEGVYDEYLPDIREAVAALEF